MLAALALFLQVIIPGPLPPPVLHLDGTPVTVLPHLPTPEEQWPSAFVHPLPNGNYMVYQEGKPVTLIDHLPNGDWQVITPPGPTLPGMNPEDEGE